ncbi:hypothetical protein HMPREF3180_00747 [Leptotrichia wadei]|uniref:Uncharacterized protein n=1 Tax=Leptotrichia wadei TaxID=157687 RepID=A0A134AKP7_9FUSO|nr:hypothetical protein HMPREF3180_00747 [Leptotrichia wadei]
MLIFQIVDNVFLSNWFYSNLFLAKREKQFEFEKGEVYKIKQGKKV